MPKIQTHHYVNVDTNTCYKNVLFILVISIQFQLIVLFKEWGKYVKADIAIEVKPCDFDPIRRIIGIELVKVVLEIKDIIQSVTIETQNQVDDSKKF